MSEAIRIDDPALIDLLASGPRQEIVDTLAATGPSSIADLAVELAVPADTLYFHVRKLIKAGLVTECGTRQTEGRDAALYAVPSALQLGYDPENPANVHAVTRAAAAMLRLAGRDFATGFRVGEPVVQGSERNLWSGRQKLWLTDEELVELNAVLARLLDPGRFRRRPGARHLCSLTVVLAPLDARPPRRGEGAG